MSTRIEGFLGYVQAIAPPHRPFPIVNDNALHLAYAIGDNVARNLQGVVAGLSPQALEGPFKAGLVGHSLDRLDVITADPQTVRRIVLFNTS